MATALFFGSFNPIHVGHMMIASSMLDVEGVDEVWLVVSPHNPLKEREMLMDDYLRLRITRLAVADNPRINVCDIEFRLPTPNYTYLTLEALAQRYPEREFRLVIGADNLAIFDRWRNYEQILERYPIIVYPRPGVGECPLMKRPSVQVVDMPLLDISSTLIRQRIAEGKDVRYMVTEPVYSALHGLCSSLFKRAKQ